MIVEKKIKERKFVYKGKWELIYRCPYCQKELKIFAVFNGLKTCSGCYKFVDENNVEEIFRRKIWTYIPNILERFLGKREKWHYEHRTREEHLAAKKKKK